MSPTWQTALCWTVLGWVGRIAVVAGMTGLLLQVLRVRSSAARHAAWRLVLAGMLLMPMLDGLAPRIDVPVRAFPTVVATETPAVEPGPPSTVSDGGVRLNANTTRSSSGVVLAWSAEPSAKPSRSLLLPRPSWSLALLVVWLVGSLLLVARLGLGFAAQRRLARASEPVDATGLWSVRRVSSLAVPVSIGVVSPCVLVPTAWSDWPDETRRAVLAHEFAHLRRRDPLVLFAARINVCLFWFNPLAWWLERRLASTAEEACDQAGAAATAEPRRYAEILLDMAEAVSRLGSRVAWRAVGIDGRGLERRIERVLRSEFHREPPAWRRAAVLLGCVAALAIVVSCRPRTSSDATPLKADPGVSERIAKDAQANKEFEAATRLTAAQVADLEAKVAASPEDLDSRRTLGIFYRMSGTHTVSWDATVAARRRHILWLIEHHPDSRTLLDWGAIYPAHDPAGYAAARKAWLAQVEQHPEDVEALSNAAYFFEVTDKVLAVSLLQRARRLDPGGPTPPMVDGLYYPSWTSRMARVYALALMGVVSAPHPGAIGEVRVEEAHSPFAVEVRKTLATTRDPNLLGATGRELTYAGRSVKEKLDFDPIALGRQYAEQAAKLAPEDARLKRLLAGLYRAEGRERAMLLLKAVPEDRRVEAILALDEDERFPLLSWLAETEATRAESFEWTDHDPKGAARARQAAERYARDALTLATERTRDARYGTAVFGAHMALAMLALSDSGSGVALQHLRAASEIPPSADLQYYDDLVWRRVCVGLLKRGERESVASFLEAYAAMNDPNRENLLKAAASIRRGVMPDFFQYAMVIKY